MSEKITHKIKRLFKSIGPGFITGASDDDPTAIAAYVQSGAQFGYKQLWTALFTFPFMTVIQEMSGRIGMVTGKGLAGTMRKNYPKSFLYFAVALLFIANTINIGADLGAMAASGQLLLNIPFGVWLLGIVALTLIMEIFISYKTYSRFLKYLALTLVTYVGVAFLVKQDWRAIAFHTFIPYFSLDKNYLLNLAAILGTNIAPYLFFWQASEEVEEEVEHHKIIAIGRGVPKVTYKDIKQLRFDTTVGMFFSNVIVFFIGITAASTIGRLGIVNIQTPAEAAMTLEPLAGKFASALFSLGVIGSGLLAVPILAGSASYALSESLNIKEGLYRKFTKAHGFYGVITIATLLGILVNFTPIKPFQMLIYAAAVNALMAPPLMIFILVVANNKKIMGRNVNSIWSNFFGILITVAMIVASAALLWSMWKK